MQDDRSIVGLAIAHGRTPRSRRVMLRNALLSHCNSLTPNSRPLRHCGEAISVVPAALGRAIQGRRFDSARPQLNRTADGAGLPRDAALAPRRSASCPQVMHARSFRVEQVRVMRNGIQIVACRCDFRRRRCGCGSRLRRRCRRGNDSGRRRRGCGVGCGRRHSRGCRREQ
jgi:hypothetical protein